MAAAESLSIQWWSDNALKKNHKKCPGGSWLESVQARGGTKPHFRKYLWSYLDFSRKKYILYLCHTVLYLQEKFSRIKNVRPTYLYYWDAIYKYFQRYSPCLGLAMMHNANWCLVHITESLLSRVHSFTPEHAFTNALLGAVATQTDRQARY